MTLSASSRTLLILLSLALLLLALLFLTGGDEGAVEDQAVRLFGGGEVEAVEIGLDAGRRYRLERRGETWYLSEPIESLADEETIKVLTTLTEEMVAVPLEYDGNEGADNLAEFGIGTDEEFRLALRRADGSVEELLLGRGIPLDVGYVYAWDPGDAKLYKVQREIREFLDRTLFEMRNKRLSFLSLDDVREVSIKSDEGLLRLERKDGWWEISEPFKAPAASRAVEALLQGLSALRARDFPESQGAAGPVRRLTLRTRDGETESISIGDTYSDGLTLVDAALPGGPFGVESAALEELPFTLEEFRSKSILRYRPEEIDTVRIASPEAGFSLHRQDGRWYLADGPELRADSALIGRLLQGLVQVEGDALPEADSEEIRQRSEYRLVLTEPDGREHSLWLAADRGEEDTFLGVSSFREEPFTLRGTGLQDLPLTPGQFEERQILYFDSREIEIIEYNSATERIRIEKRGSDWFLSRPSRKAANNPAVWRLLFAAEELRFSRRVPGAEAESLALDTSMELRLLSADGKQAAALTIYSDSQSGAVYAESSDRKGIFLIDPSSIEELTTGSEELSFVR